VCPNCKFKYEFVEKIKVCRNEIGRKRTKDIKSFWSVNDLKRVEMFTKVKNFYYSLWQLNNTYSTQDISKRIGLYSQTKGDLLRIMLDNLVCLGLLTKKYQRGKKGHLYTKIEFNKKCKYWNEYLHQCDGFFN
jgi:predicted transcriptional regulator